MRNANPYVFATTVCERDFDHEKWQKLTAQRGSEITNPTAVLCSGRNSRILPTCSYPSHCWPPRSRRTRAPGPVRMSRRYSVTPGATFTMRRAATAGPCTARGFAKAHAKIPAPAMDTTGAFPCVTRTAQRSSRCTRLLPLWKPPLWPAAALRPCAPLTTHPRTHPPPH